MKNEERSAMDWPDCSHLIFHMGGQYP